LRTLKRIEKALITFITDDYINYLYKGYTTTKFAYIDKNDFNKEDTWKKLTSLLEASVIYRKPINLILEVRQRLYEDSKDSYVNQDFLIRVEEP